MSRLQGWSAFDDGIAGQDDGSTPSSQGMRNQPPTQSFQNAGQQLGGRYNNNGSGMAGIPSSANVAFMQGGGPPRSGGGMQQPNSRGEEEEAFLRPVSEGKGDSLSSMTGLMSQGGKQPSAPHSPQQQQRPIGPMTGTGGGGQAYDSGSIAGFGGHEMPGSNQQMLMRNDGYMQSTGLRTSPIGQLGGRVSPTSQYPSGAGGGMLRMAGFQSIQGILTFEQQQGFKNQQPQTGNIDGMRYPTRPSPPNGASLSSSPTSQLSQSPYRYERSGADDLADMLGSTHLDRDAQLMQSLQSNHRAPPQHQMQQFQEFINSQQQAGGQGWQQGQQQQQQQQQHHQQQGQQQQQQGQQQQGQQDMPPKGYKTVICKFWENNMCTKGPTCTFAHGTDDLKRFSSSGPAFRNMAGSGLPSALKMDRYKTKLCLFHMQSRCCKGPHCPYAHGIDELRASIAPGVLNALHSRFGNGGLPGGAEFPSGPQDDQVLRAYVDEYQLRELMALQGGSTSALNLNLQGLVGGGSGSSSDLNLNLVGGGSGMGNGMGQGQGGMNASMGLGMGQGQGQRQQQQQSSMGGLQNLGGFSSFSENGNSSFGDGGDSRQQQQHGMGMDSNKDIDQQQQLAALRYFDRGQQEGMSNKMYERNQAQMQQQQQQQQQHGHLNSLQQQVNARVAANPQQQQQQQQQQHQIIAQQQMLMMEGNRQVATGASSGNQSGSDQSQANLPPSVLAYRPVNLWPHGPSWQPEEQ